MTTKLCCKCQTERSTDDYNKRLDHADCLDSWCKFCRAIQRKARRQARPDRRDIERRQRKLTKSKQANTAINRMRKLLNDRLKPQGSSHHPEAG